MKTQTRAVVIGGGIAGCSTLYHLTQEGWTDVVLVERKLRGALGHSVGNQLRVVPELILRTDDSLEYEENIERLLRGDGESPIK